jgi:hypothetical protein
MPTMRERISLSRFAPQHNLGVQWSQRRTGVIGVILLVDRRRDCEVGRPRGPAMPP